ncbi:hypothetical protein ACFLWD_01415 [Chloroflexota bacterium]
MNENYNQLNDLLAFLSPVVPNNPDAVQIDALTSQKSLVQIQYRPPCQQFT